jgi:hypothetical protein
VTFAMLLEMVEDYSTRGCLTILTLSSIGAIDASFVSPFPCHSGARVEGGTPNGWIRMSSDGRC